MTAKKTTQPPTTAPKLPELNEQTMQVIREATSHIVGKLLRNKPTLFLDVSLSMDAVKNNTLWQNLKNDILAHVDEKTYWFCDRVFSASKLSTSHIGTTSKYSGGTSLDTLFEFILKHTDEVDGDIKGDIIIVTDARDGCHSFAIDRLRPIQHRLTMIHLNTTPSWLAQLVSDHCPLSRHVSINIDTATFKTDPATWSFLPIEKPVKIIDDPSIGIKHGAMTQSNEWGFYVSPCTCSCCLSPIEVGHHSYRRGKITLCADCTGDLVTIQAYVYQR